MRVVAAPAVGLAIVFVLFLPGAGRAQSQTAILLIEQHVKFALAVADRYAVLKLGEIVDRGSVADAGAEKSIGEHLSV